MQKEIEYYLKLIRENPYKFRELSDEVKIKYPEICEEAVKLNNKFIKDVPEEILNKNASMMIKAVKQDLKLLEFIPESALRKHPKICLKAVAKYPELLEYVPENVKIEHPEICIDAVRAINSLLEYVPKEVQIKHPKISFEAIEINSFYIKYVPMDVLKRNPDFVYNLIRKTNYNDKYIFAIPTELNEMFPDKCLELAYEHSDCFNMVSDKLKMQHLDLCISAAKSGKYTPSDFPKNMLEKHPELYIDLIENYKGDLFSKDSWFKGLSNDLKLQNAGIYIAALKNCEDKEIQRIEKNFPDYYKEEYPEDYSAALKKCDGKAIQIIKGNLPDNYMEEHPEFCIEAVKINPNNMKYISENIIKNYADSFYEIVKENTDLIKYMPKEFLLINPELYKKALEDNVPLKFIPDEIQVQYEELTLKVLKESEGEWWSDEYIYNFENLSEKIKIKNWDSCVVDAIKKWNNILHLISYRNEDIEEEHYIYDFIPKELLENQEFVKKVYEENADTSIIFRCSDEMRKEILNSGKNGVVIGSEWQEECLQEIKYKQNVILSSPTGSGKTNVFLQWAKQKSQRPIYITAPIKALSNQRWRELKEQGFIVRIRNGRYKKCA